MKWKKILTGVLWLTAGSFLWGESILTLPVPTEIETYGPAVKEVRPMVLKISIPPRRKHGEKKVKKEDILKPKKRNFDYFDFNPFPKIKNYQKYYKLIKEMAPLVRNPMLSSDLIGTTFHFKKSLNVYDIRRLIVAIFKNIEKYDTDTLAKKFNWKKEQIDVLQQLLKQNKKNLSVYLINADKISQKLKELKKYLDYNQGVIRVIKVENDPHGGGTILKFVFQPADNNTNSNTNNYNY